MGAPHPYLLPLLTGGELPDGAEVTAEVVASAEEHFVAALIDQAVVDRDLPMAPGLQARLRASAIAVDAENRVAEATAVRTAGIAEGLGIDLCIFKGIVIGQRFYDDPRRRPTIDVDVFVGPDAVERLGELATALGAEPEDAEAIDLMVRSDRVFEVEVAVGDTMVDLHRDPMNLLLVAADEQDRWDRTTTLSLPGGVDIRTLDLEDTVLQALVHLFRDNYADLLHVNDVRLMMAAGPDWDEIARRADLNGWTPLVRHAAWFVATRVGNPSPLPTTIPRWQKHAIDVVWPRSLLLRGSTSHARSLRRQSMAGTLVNGRRRAAARAYAQRLMPPRTVIDQRSGRSGGSYAAALIRWRRSQRAENKRRRDASYGDGA